MKTPDQDQNLLSKMLKYYYIQKGLLSNDYKVPMLIWTKIIYNKINNLRQIFYYCMKT